LSSLPQYKNPGLEHKINENKDKLELYLSDQGLTDDDMEIVAYYVLKNNKVSNVVFFLLLKGRQEFCSHLFSC
jgi:hypothetical protein